MTPFEEGTPLSRGSAAAAALSARAKLLKIPSHTWCASYSGIESNAGAVVFSCADEVFSKLPPGTRVLVVDDIFDTGKTAAAIKAKMTALGVDMRLACVYWKPDKNTTDLEPDFYTRKLDNSWIVFPHEMEGLTPEEIREKDPVLAELTIPAT